MNVLTDSELNGVCGGMQPSAMTLLGEQLAADGLAYMDSENELKAGLGIFIAAGGGWTWAFGSAWDGLRSWFG